MFLELRTPRSECSAGDVRLAGSENISFHGPNLQGRIELCLNNAWGTICNDSFGSEEVTVVCNQIPGVTSEGKLRLLHIKINISMLYL